METAVTPLLEKLKAIKRELPQIVLELVKDIEGFVIDLQLKQLEEGKNSKGENITPVYSERYRRRKRKPSQYPNLKDTGDYYKSFEINYNNSSGTFSLNATNFVSEYLLKRYGEEIEGLTDENISVISRKIESNLSKIIQDKINS